MAMMRDQNGDVVPEDVRWETVVLPDGRGVSGWGKTMGVSAGGFHHDFHRYLYPTRARARAAWVDDWPERCIAQVF